MKVWKSKLILSFFAVVLLLSLGLGGLVYHYGQTYEKTFGVYMKSLDWVLPHSNAYSSIYADEEQAGRYCCYRDDEIDLIDTTGNLVETKDRSDGQVDESLPTEDTRILDGDKQVRPTDHDGYEIFDIKTGETWSSYKGRKFHSVWRIDEHEFAIGFLTRTKTQDDIDYMVFDEEMKPIFGDRLFTFIARESEGMRYFVSSERTFDGKPAKVECGFMDEKGETVFAFDHEPVCANDFSEGIALVYDDQLCGYDKTGKKVFVLDYTGEAVAPDFHAMADEYAFWSPYFTWFVDGLAPATLDGQHWGYINQSGKFVIEPYFKEVHIVMNKTAAVCLVQSNIQSTLSNSRWGILDLKEVQ